MSRTLKLAAAALAAAALTTVALAQKAEFGTSAEAKAMEERVIKELKANEAAAVICFAVSCPTDQTGALEKQPRRETRPPRLVSMVLMRFARGHRLHVGGVLHQRPDGGSAGGWPPCGGPPSPSATAPSWVQRSVNTTPPSGRYPFARQPGLDGGGSEYATAGVE